MSYTPLVKKLSLIFGQLTPSTGSLDWDLTPK
nr:MAG TPA: hypothetical protein [Caudoviricetes sp.]